MQATLDASSLKHLTRALTCLARYGEDVVIYATRLHLVVSATNSSLSAYCRFKYSRDFFSRYTVQEDPTWDMKDDTVRVSGQLQVKSLLASLKSVTVAKSVERCELTVTEGGVAQQLDEEENDSLSSKLIVRLHCKHGIVKTHRLLLNHATNLMSPGVLNPEHESKLTIGARSLKDLLDHFPIARGPKSDPQIILTLGDEEVILKAQESSLDTSVKGQLATELSISPAEFEAYDVFEPPFTVCLHLRELMATLAFAEAQALTLDLRFTEPSAPVFIDVDGDLAETLFVIATSEVRDEDVPAGVPRARSHSARADSLQPRGRKRELSAEPEGRALATPRRKPQKVVVRASRESVGRELPSQSSRGSVARAMAPPPLPPHAMAPPSSNPFAPSPSPRARDPLFSQEPLFLPGSQVPLSQAAAAAVRESGLGIEDMDEAAFAAMMDGEGEEVGFGAPLPGAHADADMRRDAEIDEEERDELDELDELDDDAAMRESSFGLCDDAHTEFAPTQGDTSAKAFRPLFDD